MECNSISDREVIDHSSIKILKITKIEPHRTLKRPFKLNESTHHGHDSFGKKFRCRLKKSLNMRLELSNIPQNVWNIVIDYMCIKEILVFSVVSKYALRLVNDYPDVQARINRVFHTRMGLEYIRHHNKNEIDRDLRPINKELNECKGYYRALSSLFFKIWGITSLILISIITPILHSVSTPDIVILINSYRS